MTAKIKAGFKSNMSLSNKFLHFSIMALFVFSQNKVFAQTEAEIFTAKNLIYAEFAGNSRG